MKGSNVYLEMDAGILVGRRWRNFTGDATALERVGRRFDEMAVARGHSGEEAGSETKAEKPRRPSALSTEREAPQGGAWR